MFQILQVVFSCLGVICGACATIKSREESKEQIKDEIRKELQEKK